jgi:TolA-binding protein
MPCISRTFLAIVLVAGLTASAAAQQGVTATDIQRLQDNAAQAGADVSKLRSQNAARGNQLQTELNDLSDEVIYLKVKLRKEKSVARSEYLDLLDRLDTFRSRARTEAVNAAAPAPSAPAAAVAPAPKPVPAPAPAAATAAPKPAVPAAPTELEIPAGTELDARLINTLTTETAKVEDRFEATAAADLSVGGRLAIPAGAALRGVVTAVEPATRTNRTARMTVSFDQVTVNGRAYPMRGTVTQALEGEGVRGEAGRIGAGAGVGAIVGGLLGGLRGALAGVLIGGGGTLAATEGEQLRLPQGTVLRVRIESPLRIAAR